MDFRLGQKVLAYPNSEEGRIGFIINPDADENGKLGVQVGSDVYGLNHDEEAAEGSRGGTFRTLGK